MPPWSLHAALSALAIAFLAGFTAQLIARRPLAQLWPSLPLSFSAALLFSIGDLVAVVFSGFPMAHWVGLVILYTGLLLFAPSWWAFTLRYVELYSGGPIRGQSALMWAPAVLNGVLWFGLVSNPWHGLYLEPDPNLGQSHYGPLWYVAAVTNYGLILASLIFHLRLSFGASDPVLRSQSRALALGTAIPLTGSLLFVSFPGLAPFDPTAPGLCISCGIFLFAIHRRSLFVLRSVSLPDVFGRDSDALLLVTEDLRLLYSNKAAAKLLPEVSLAPGASMVEVFRNRFPTLYIVGATDGATRDTVQREKQEHLFIDDRGSNHWFEIEVTPLSRRRRMSAGFCVRLRDRTALREATRSVAAHVALLEAVDLATGQGLVVFDRDGTIRYVNEAVAEIWGLPRESLEAPSRSSLLAAISKRVDSDLEVQRDMAEFEREIDQSPDHEVTRDVLAADGRIIEIAVFPINSRTGFAGRVCRMMDATQQRREADAVLHTQKLEGLGVLAGGIAHDFNNLLMAMLGNAELARMELPDDSPALCHLADVETAAERAGELTDQLLTYTGKGTFVREEIDLSDLVLGVAGLLSVSISKGVDLDYNLAQELPPIRGGSGQLRQIVMNLVTNAADSIGEKEGQIRLETGIGLAPKASYSGATVSFGEPFESSVYLRVTDDGGGMEEDTLSRIFDPFFTTKFAGRGLGLAAVLGIIKSHDGCLRVDSSLGSGSSFTVSLPVAEGTGDATITRAGKAVRIAPRRPILVVDDEPHVRTVLERMIKRHGFEVITASDGVEAIELYRSQSEPIGLVILDLTMPGLNGEQTWAHLRAFDPAVRVLFSSGYSEENAEFRFREPDARAAFIHKPYRREELLERIHDLLAD